MSASTAAPAIRARKGDGTPLVMVTAYDTPSARIVDDAGADIILVGDSVAMVVLGYDDTCRSRSTTWPTTPPPWPGPGPRPWWWPTCRG